jgi:hypothetical protein
MKSLSQTRRSLLSGWRAFALLRKSRSRVQLEQQQAQELETEQQGQNSMDMQRSSSDRGKDADEGGVFEEHISSSRKLAISGTNPL